MLQPRFPVPPDMVATRAAVPARDAEAHAAARARAARRGRAAVRPGGAARSTSRSGATRSTRCRIAPASWCAAISRSRRAWSSAEPVVGRRPAGQGQDQGARAVLDQRGVLRGPRPDGPDDRLREDVLATAYRTCQARHVRDSGDPRLSRGNSDRGAGGRRHSGVRVEGAVSVARRGMRRRTREPRQLHDVPRGHRAARER